MGIFNEPGPRAVCDWQGNRPAMPLRLIEPADSETAVYHDRYGNEVVLGDGGNVLVDLTDIDVDVARGRWETSAAFGSVGFIDWLKSWVTDSNHVDWYIHSCGDCGVLHHEDDMEPTNDDSDSVCQGCSDYYTTCESCEQRFRDTYTTLGDAEVCYRCRDNYYYYCENCDGYVHNDNDDHYHDDEDDCPEGCVSPALSFTIRNDGLAPLPEDTPVKMTLAAGVISDEGLEQIAFTIRDYARSVRYLDEGQPNDDFLKLWSVAAELDKIGPEWQTRQGNWTKRLSRYAYKTHGVSLPPSLISSAGNVASAHSRGVDFEIEVTRDLNQSAGDFFHEESCWWQSYYHGRCALKTNGGFGMRTFKTEVGFNGAEYRNVTGRAWVMPLRLTGKAQARRDPNLCSDPVCCPPPPGAPSGAPMLAPTFDTMTPDAFVVFNGYGDLSGYGPARIMAHMAGMTYRKVAFTCAPMYVNGEQGYLVAPEELAEKYTDGRLSLSVPQHADLYETEKNESKELTNA